MIDIKRIGMLGVFLASLALLLGVSLSNERPAEAAVTTFEVGLSGLEEVPVATSTGYGHARFTFDDQTRVLTYFLTVSGISPGEVLFAHIHRGAAGVNGPIVHFLSATGFTQVSGTITLSEADVADLRAGNFYANVHSVANPGGFARGQMYLNAEDAIRATGTAVISAFNRASPTFFSYFTDAGLESAFDLTREEALELGRDFFQGSPPLSLRSLRVINSSGSAATIEVELAFGAQLDRTREEWVITEGGWKINGQTDLPENVPAGATVINTRMGEYFYSHSNQAALSTGNFVLMLDNVGKEPHEAVISRIERTEPLQQIFALGGDDGPPPGVIPIAQAFAEPGDQASIAFTQSLAPGRYTITCFIPAAPNFSGPPHAILGMFTEFTVGGGASGGGAIRPPSTGDAGLLDQATASQYVLYVLMATTLLSGAALLTFSPKRI